jgi:transcription termination/antitermination protein NusA
MPRKTKEDAQFEGKIGNIRAFKSALEEIQQAYQIEPEKTLDILLSSIDKAYRDAHFSTKEILIKNPTTGEISKLPSEAKAIHSETTIDKKTGEIAFYLCKDVTNDVIDDLYQIEPEDANELDPSHEYIEGDVFKTKYTLENEPFSFFTRAMQNFNIKLKETYKQQLIEKYTDKVGQIINATVESVDAKTGNTYLIINKVNAILFANNKIPGETFFPGQTIKVLLKGIGNNEKTGEKGTTLNVTRTDELFLQRLFEQEIPDIADGSVKVRKIAREAGIRAKVAVSSDDPNIDPSGACIGSDGSRIKDINSEIGSEKIDVIKYYDNKYLYIAEALRPALVIGVVLKDNEPVAVGKAPKAIAIVDNDNSKIAIGKSGINVRLASKLTGYSIDVKEIDAAMGEHIQYTNINDLKKNDALERLAQESLNIPDEEYEQGDEEEAEDYVRNNTTEDILPEEKFDSPKAEVKENKVEEVKVEESKPEVVEHVEITTKAKVSLSELEAQIEEEKKANKQASSKSYKKKEEKKEDKKEVKKPVASAMPIYSEEEIKQMDEEDQEEEYQDEEDYDEYDDDSYYENN